MIKYKKALNEQLFLSRFVTVSQMLWDLLMLMFMFRSYYVVFAYEKKNMT